MRSGRSGRADREGSSNRRAGRANAVQVRGAVGDRQEAVPGAHRQQHHHHQQPQHNQQQQRKQLRPTFHHPVLPGCPLQAIRAVPANGGSTSGKPHRCRPHLYGPPQAIPTAAAATAEAPLRPIEPLV